MISAILALIQRFVAADKAAATAVLISGLALLCIHLGLRLNASDTAYLGILASFLVGAFLHAHFAAKSAPAQPGEHQKP